MNIIGDGSETAQVVIEDHCDDGSILLDHVAALPEVSGAMFGRLAYWAERSPNAVWLSEDDRQISFLEAERERRRLSASILAMGLDRSRPLAIIASNGIDHALTMLAATAVGIPVAIISPAYIFESVELWGRLSDALEQIQASLILTDNVDVVSDVLSNNGRPLPVARLDGCAWAKGVAPVSGDVVRAVEATVGPETVAKLLFVPDPTGVLKAVMNTQRMMVSNMLALSIVWPFLSKKPPVMVDWLPWNHTFGGNCCFNIALWFGGHLHIDKGRPAPSLIGHTVSAIKAVKPTIFFNIPLGYELLIAELEKDLVVAGEFLERLDFLFNATAPLSDAIQQRLTRLAVATTGRKPRILGGWGSTETAPFSTVLNHPTGHMINLGVPIPGTTLKLVPIRGGFELRVLGPNVMPGYWRDAEGTAVAFDEEGFYRTGGVGKFADPYYPSRGIVLAGYVTDHSKINPAELLANSLDFRGSDVKTCGEHNDNFRNKMITRLSFENYEYYFEECNCREHLMENELKISSDRKIIKSKFIKNYISTVILSDIVGDIHADGYEI